MQNRPSANLKLLASLLILLMFQLIGLALTNWLNWRFPGAVMGMFLLFLVLAIISPRTSNSLTTLANRLIAFLPLFLLPISVGITEYQTIIKENITVIALVILLTTPLGLAAAAMLFQKAQRHD